MKDFQYRTTANRHYQNSHLTFEKLPCSVCGIELKNLTSLQKHSRNAHGLRLKDLERTVVPNNPKMM